MAVPHDDSWLIFSPEGNSTPTKDRVARKRPIGCRALLFVRQPRQPFFFTSCPVNRRAGQSVVDKMQGIVRRAGHGGRTPEHAHIVHVDMYCKSRIFRTHSIFVFWALRPFVRMNFSYRKIFDRCRFSGMLCTFRMHFIFVRKAARTKYTKITCIRNILDLQYPEKFILDLHGLI